MPSIRDMNMKQLNNADWSSISFEPETLQNHPAIIGRILKTYPNQVANFCVNQLDLEIVRCIGVDNVVKLMKRAGVTCLKRKDPLPQDIMISEFQYPKQFLNEFKSVLDMSKIYNQDCVDVDMLVSNIKDLDIIEAIVFNAKHNNKNADFISRCKGHIIDAMINDSKSCVISIKYLVECCKDLNVSMIVRKNHDRKLSKELVKQIELYYNMSVPVEFIDKTLEEIAYLMNTNKIKSMYLTLCTVDNFLREHENE